MQQQANCVVHFTYAGKTSVNDQKIHKHDLKSFNQAKFPTIDEMY